MSNLRKSVVMNVEEFIRESNRIEGILRDPTKAEISEFHRFMNVRRLDVTDLERFVHVYQPGAVLRTKPGQDVRVGTHYPPPGRPEIKVWLNALLLDMEVVGPYETHVRYETLHPFTDGNGRSGRMLWLWQMGDAPRGFLHEFYYQALQQER